MKQSKIAIIGAGSVGTSTAFALMLKNIGSEIMLVDVDSARCHGEILDLSDAQSFCTNTKIYAANQQQAAQADIIIIAAGIRQKPEQTRQELLSKNKEIIGSIITQLKPIKSSAIIIMVTNPVDILTLHALQLSGLPAHQVIGSGTLLDSIRLRELIATKLHKALSSIDINILGEHGDTQFPAWSSAHIDGAPLANFGISQKELDSFAQQAKDKAYEIIKCKDATFYGIATCVTQLCQAIIQDQKLIAPVSHFQKQFGICLSLPAVLGRNGIEQTLPLSLNNQEQILLEKSAQALNL